MITFACHRRDVATTTYRACARLLIAASLLLAAGAAAQPAGSGLFIELQDGQELDDIATVALTTPGRPTGVQLHVCWSSIQNDPNHWTVYDWTELALWLDAVDAYGLKAILRIDMIGGATTGATHPTIDAALSTPPWLFDLLNVAYIGGQDGDNLGLDAGDYPSGSSRHYIPRLPWYGDTVYQARVAAFAGELRQFLMGENEYSEEPDRSGLIEMVRIGGWQANSNEPNFYRDYTDPNVSVNSDCYPCDEWKTAVKTALIADLQAKGVAYNFDGTPLLDDVSVYANASKTMVDGWIAAFDGSGIPLSTTVNLRLRPCTADNEFLMYSLTNGMVVLNPGLNAKEKTKTRDYFGQWSDPSGPYGVKVGWGGVTGLPTDPNLDHTRIGAAFQGFGWNGTSTLPDCIANSTDPDWTQYRHETLPRSEALYAIFGTNFLGAGFQNAFDCAREMIQTFTAQ